MRGIAGIIHFDGRPVEAPLVERMIHRMALGPVDRIAHWHEGPAGFAHLIRNIQPEDRFEAQPLRSADGNLVLVTDALLENRAELAAALDLPPAETGSLPDSTFVLRAYEKWGEDCPRHLDGRFALAVWQVRERKLFCAVDPFALRPLYTFRRGDLFAFASTLRGLLSLPQVSRRLNDGVLTDFLLGTQSEPRDRTLYADLTCLPAAHRLMVTKDRAAIDRYWTPDISGPLRSDSPQDCLEAFRAEFERAVTAGLRVTGDVGIMVSGGLDSAATTAMAGQILQREGKRLQAIHRLPSGTDPRRAHLREHDESHHVRLMQQHSPHIDFHFVPPQDDVTVSLERWSGLFGEHCVPLRSPVFAQPYDPVSPLVLDRLLNGFGGNAIVSVESPNSSYLAELTVTLRWRRLLAEMRGQKRIYGRSLKHTFRRQVLAAFIPRRGAALSHSALVPFLSPDLVRRVGLPDRLRAGDSPWFRAENFNVRRLFRHVLTDIRPQHVGVAGSVITSKAGPDVYSPFFNRRLNEFCLTIPPSMQIQNGWDRLLLRRSMRGLLPDAVAWRRTRGFPIPDSWRAALSVQATLPAALAQMKRSALVNDHLALDRIEHLLVPSGALALTHLSAFQFVTLFNVAWFLHWLDGQTTG